MQYIQYIVLPLSMNSRAKLSKFACKVTEKDTISTKEPETVFSKGQDTILTSVNTTPIGRRNIIKDDEEEEHLSPFNMRCTQDCGDGDDEFDVVWDWDSPRSKGNRSLHRKRLLHSSPKIPKEQIPGDKNPPRFNSLKAELEQLANKLNHQENGFDSADIFVKPKAPVSPEIQVLFDDDSFDEEMIKCSQQVEESHNLNKWCSSIMNNNKEYKPSDNKSHLLDTIQDDSFDIFLEEIDDEDIQKLSQPSSRSPNTCPPMILTKSKLISSPRSISRTASVPTEFFTKPKPISTVTSSSLVCRTKSDETGKSQIIQCSPEEIEKKRQDARAKLEFKKKQQEIEKKRLEALERLKRNRNQKMFSQISQKS